MHVVSLLEQEFGRTAARDMLPMQPGDVPETFADVDDLARDIGFRPATPIEDGIARFANMVSRLSQALTAGRNEQTNYSTDHVRRRRNAAVAGLARSPSRSSSCHCSDRARPFRIRCCGCRMRRCSSGRSSSPTPPIASWCWSNWPRSGSRPTSCWSRCGGIPGRRSPRARPLRRAATARRSCWRSPPTTWSAIPPAFVAACRQGLAAAEAGRIVTFGVAPERAGHRIRLHQPGRSRLPARSAASPNSSRSRIRRPPPNTSRRAISGTAATSCSAPPCCSTNIATSMPTACRPSPIP